MPSRLAASDTARIGWSRAVFSEARRRPSNPSLPGQVGKLVNDSVIVDRARLLTVGSIQTVATAILNAVV